MQICKIVKFRNQQHQKLFLNNHANAETRYGDYIATHYDHNMYLTDEHVMSWIKD